MPAKWIMFKPEARTTPVGIGRLSRISRVVVDTAPNLHGDTVFITSMNDSEVHIAGSLHDVNAAFDIRTHPNPDGTPRLGCILDKQIDTAAKVWLGHIKRFLAVEDPGWEGQYEAQKQHIHLEFDPK